MKMKFGAIVVDGRGKIGGHVASKNRSGSYLRTKTTPVNPQSSAQMTARSSLATNSKGWAGLTDAQRNDWNSATELYSKTNIFGDKVLPTGKNLYTAINCNLALASVAAISSPLAPISVPAPSSLTLTSDNSDQSLSLVYAATPVPANTVYMVEATEGVSAGTAFVKSKYRKIEVLAAAATSPADLAASYIAKFGSVPAAGKKIFVRVTAISKTTGQRSTPLQTSCTVTA